MAPATRSSPDKSKKRRGNASGRAKKGGSEKKKARRTRTTKRDSDLVQMGNKPGRSIVVEKQPKEGSVLDPGSFVQEFSPSKARPSRKPTASSETPESQSSFNRRFLPVKKMGPLLSAMCNNNKSTQKVEQTSRAKINKQSKVPPPESPTLPSCFQQHG